MGKDNRVTLLYFDDIVYIHNIFRVCRKQHKCMNNFLNSSPDLDNLPYFSLSTNFSRDKASLLYLKSISKLSFIRAKDRIFSGKAFHIFMP
jgi:hypothetical protein